MFFIKKPILGQGKLKTYCIVFFLFSVFSLCHAEPAKLLVVGDSLSAAHGIPPETGWVTLLSERLKTEGYPVEVVNRSVSGASTQDGLNRLPNWLAEVNPQYVLLALGSNDGLRGTPIRRIRNNIEKMIEQVEEADAEPILVGLMVPPNYGQPYFEAFRDLFPDLAEEEELPFVPFLLAKVADDKQAYFQEDGLHPNVAAQTLILDNVWPTLRSVLKRRD